MAESEEELKSLLMRVKEESDKAGLKLNMKNTKIMVSGPITSWQIEGGKLEAVTDFLLLTFKKGFPGGFSSKELTCQYRRHRGLGSIPGWGRSPGGGNGNPFQYSCLVNPMDRGAWQATVHGVTNSQTWLK